MVSIAASMTAAPPGDAGGDARGDAAGGGAGEAAGGGVTDGASGGGWSVSLMIANWLASVQDAVPRHGPP